MAQGFAKSGHSINPISFYSLLGNVTGGSGSGTVTSVQLSAGTGISLSGTNPITTSGVITILNSSPDQLVSLTQGGTTTITGTYPNFTISSADQYVGTVTSIATAGLLSGGTITSSGTITTSMSTNKLVGRSTAGTGIMEEITVGSGLTLSGGTLSSTTTGGGISHGTASGTDTYTVTISGVTSYADGDAYLISFTNGNTTSCTLNINGLGAVSLRRNNDGALIGGDIVADGEILCVYNASVPSFQCIGTAPNTLLAYVTNAESITINKGQPVYVFGGTGDRITVKLAYNSTDITSAQTIGVVQSTSIAANQKGLIIIQGQLDNLSLFPTSTWADGDYIYLGATAGTLTNVKPVAPNHLVYLGYVTTASNGSAGRMYVKVQNGYELDEIHNVQLSGVTNSDVLVYESATSLWKNKPISGVLGYVPQAQLSGTGVVKSTAGTISYINGTSAQYIAGDGSLISFPTIPTVGTWGALNYPTWTTGTPFVKMTAAGTFALDTTTYLSSISSSNVTTALGYTPVTNVRTLSINGTSYDLSANRTWTVGTVTSVALSGSSAFAITSSPITTSGTITISGTGTTSQYIDGTGSLQSFPSITKFSSNRPVATTASVTTYGAWYKQFWPSTAATTNTTLNQNQLWLMPVQLPAGLVINEIAFAITTAGSAGALVSVGIYSSTTVNGEIRADALLSNFGSVSTSTSGKKVITSLNYTVPSGTTDWYCIALLGTVAAPGNIAFISNHVKQYIGFTTAGGTQYSAWTLSAQSSFPATVSLATWLTGTDSASLIQIGYK